MRLRNFGLKFEFATVTFIHIVTTILSFSAEDTLVTNKETFKNGNAWFSLPTKHTWNSNRKYSLLKLRLEHFLHNMTSASNTTLPKEKTRVTECSEAQCCKTDEMRSRLRERQLLTQIGSVILLFHRWKSEWRFLFWNLFLFNYLQLGFIDFEYKKGHVTYYADMIFLPLCAAMTVCLFRSCLFGSCLQ